ncbi:ABC transporter substrate-binding protein [Roseobacter denitrificans]|uniref:Periplasmic iron-binding protein, putative n=1 Tax=Roseobacter denitrificans (strain ATCC 33942 / OCh 114) TaxID=375451 RepID=Q164X9_ROSDO|nr:ABC transporter substrate-binding protein [Roseobacter denitrificans]ABG32464.1 periplasmic iron-binding protein, putative [Roseobacter denitrificans OCh 114]AVL51924.1 ABC transporter substrate-binding protein [Roseobacter denitrificans]SFF82148.1 iron(III) transport system substrate-binding protein [Roseobacter denitrificans OCh 114]
MRHALVLTLCLILFGTVAPAREWEDRQRFGVSDAPITLRILSSTDTALFAPVLAAFVARRSDVAIDYFVAGTADLNTLFRQSPHAYDIVISSAMDLQFKLANDGFAQPMDMPGYPDWAHWRYTLFAFTSEPAAIVLNRQAFEGRDLPRTRQEVIRVLRDNPEQFSARVGTYDVRQSGLGYLFATQDARTSETYWRLMEVMGNLDAQLYCCSGAMIEDVAAGRILLAYNVLGSYAAARADLADQLEIILPSDFQTIMMRSALISGQTPNPEISRDFMRHLLPASGSGSNALLPMLELNSDAAGQGMIELSPALLTYLDALKSKGFLAEWVDAMIQ